jgi:hypothetical protein
MPFIAQLGLHVQGVIDLSAVPRFDPSLPPEPPPTLRMNEVSRYPPDTVPAPG